jgi:hypothetical protein
MNLRTRLVRLVKALPTSSLRPHRNPLGTQYHPRFESLEERTVPSILFSNTGSRTIVDSGGPIQANQQVDVVFWGSGWNFTNIRYRTDLVNAITSIESSHYYDALSQYRNIQHGSYNQDYLITSTSPGATFTDADVRTFVQNNINSGALPAPSTNLLYFVIPQPGSSETGCGCVGDHASGFASNNRIFSYAVTTDDTGIAFDTVTTIISHELVESASNPQLNITINGVSQAAFHASGNVLDEIADGEAQYYTYRLNGILVQSYDSQRDHVYIVTDGNTQKFVVSSIGVLTINGDQLANKNDTIALDDISGGARAFLSGETVQFEPGALSSVVINTGTGDDVVNIQGTEWPATINLGDGTDSIMIGDLYHNLDRIRSTVTANSGSVSTGSGNDALYINDTANTRSDSWTLDSDGAGSGTVQRTGGPLIRYVDNPSFSQGFKRDFRIFGGSGSPTYTIHNTHFWNTNLVTGAASATVNVLGTNGGLNILASAATATVNVGNAGNAQAIDGEITVTDPGGHATVTVDDHNDGISRTPLLSTDPADTSYGQITGLAAGETIYYHYADTSTLVVYTGTTTTTVNVQATGTNVDLGADDPQGTTINLGNAGRFQPIQASMSLSNLSGPLTVNVNDQNDSTGTNVTLDAFNSGLEFTRLTGFTQATIFATSAGPSNFTVNGGSGSNTWFISGTAPGVNTAIAGGAGTNEFVVQLDVGVLAGPLALHGQPGSNSYMVYDDQFNTTPQTYTLTANTMSQSGLAPVTYDNLNEVILYPALVGGNTINMPSLAADVFANLAVANGDTLTIGANQTVASVLGTIAIGPENDNISANVVIDDSADMTPPPGAITLSNDLPNYTLAITGVVPGGIYFAADQNTTFNTSLSMGAGNKTFNVQTAPQGVALTLDGGSGTNTLDYTGFSGNVVVDLPLGTATGFSSINDIENVTGASGGGAGSYNLLIGNGGNVLNGGTGRRNILVAGGSGSTLNAGDGEDLLIGGATVYDTDSTLASWLQIAAYWAGADDYFTRIANLTTGNGVPLLDATTVIGNGGGNTINGIGALALIYSDGQDNIFGFDPNSIVVPIAP